MENFPENLEDYEGYAKSWRLFQLVFEFVENNFELLCKMAV